MSIIIKGMRAPHNCFDCKFCDNGCCIITGDSNALHLPCPIIDIPPQHGRLIDADNLADDLEYDANKEYEELYQLRSVASTIHDADNKIKQLSDDANTKANAASWLRSNLNIIYLDKDE